jgi:predicted dienelactone hydrolase
MLGLPRAAGAALALSLVVATTALAQTPAPYGVGMTRRDLADSARTSWDGHGPRPVATIIWYPVAPGTREDTVSIGPPGRALFEAGTAAPGAPIAPGRHPLVVLSHGTGGSALQLMWLAHALAERGFIVAGVNHHGNTGAESQLVPAAFVFWWERSRDLTVALDRLLADPALSPSIDGARIGAAGFSLGGASVVALAAGSFDGAAFDRFCRGPSRDFTCERQSEMPDGGGDSWESFAIDSATKTSFERRGIDYRDRRVRAVLAIGPAIAHAFTPARLRAVRVPFAAAVGTADSIAPAATNARYLATHVRGGKLTLIPGAGHYTFLSECGPIGPQVVPALCGDDPKLRRAAHEAVGGLAVAFFDRALGVPTARR